MSNSRTVLPRTPKRIGVAADHGGFESKEYLVGRLPEAHYEVVDFGDRQPKPNDDYPDFVVPLARAVARGEVDRGVAICGSGVEACIAANKVSPSGGQRAIEEDGLRGNDLESIHLRESDHGQPRL